MMAKTKRATKKKSSTRKSKPQNVPQAICKDALGIEGKGAMKRISAAKKRKLMRCERKVAARRRK